jgi:RHS repeat-associated protein
VRSITQAPLNPVEFEYDTAGRRRRLTLPNQVSTEYQYDAASRLTALMYRNALGPLGELTYEYDAAGNRIAVGGSFARTLLPEPVATATYDAANRQLTFGDRAMTFDANGNLLTDPTASHTWDARNRLTALTGATTATFTYDALGRRTERTVNAAAVQYLYDGVDIVAELQATATVPYLRGLSIDEPLVRATEDLYLTDALGSVLALTDASGTVATSYAYEPFGRTALEGAPSANPFQFTGRENDGAGLYYYRARYYPPFVQRFISEDILGTGRSTHLYPALPANLIGWTTLIRDHPREYIRELHPYAYVANSPLNAIDPMGLTANPAYQECLERAASSRRWCQRRGSFACRLFCGSIGSAPGYPGLDVLCRQVCTGVYDWACTKDDAARNADCKRRYCPDSKSDQ